MVNLKARVAGRSGIAVGMIMLALASLVVLVKRSPVALIPAVAASQAQTGATAQTYRPLRTSSGQPDLQGVWQIWNTAKYDVEPHAATYGVPAGWGVIVDPADGMIPYKPWAAAHKKQNFANSRTSDVVKNADPVAKCYLPGVPRTMYLGWPFQIVQDNQWVMFMFEWNHVRRMVSLSNATRLRGYELFMGISRARWEMDTLVIDTTNFNDSVWLDMSGNFFSKTAHVVERLTRTGPDLMDYEVTIEDPAVFTRAWKMRMPIQRQRQPRLLEYECIDLLEKSGVPPTWERDWDKPLPVPKP